MNKTTDILSSERQIAEQILKSHCSIGDWNSNTLTPEQAIDAMLEFGRTLSQEWEEAGWIPVEKQLPEVGEFVLVHNTEGAILTGRLMNNGWCANFLDGETLMGELTATHWMHLPSPPKQAETTRIPIINQNREGEI